MSRIRQIWEMLRGSFWFIPTCLVFASALLGIMLVEVDRYIEADLHAKYPRFFATGVEGAQGILQSIATSMITVAGVTFSITILILNGTSNQYSPRILRNFVRDRSNQLVLGAFLAIFVYCLIVLQAIHEIDGERFIPSLAVIGGILLAFVGIGVLIFFIHHIAYSIQASSILNRSVSETMDEINTLYPEQIGVGSDQPLDSAAELRDEDSWHTVNAIKSGYLQFTAPETVLNFAQKHDTIVRLEHGIGDFIVEGTPIALVYGREPLPEKKLKQFHKALSVSSYRTIEQDVSFGIRQLVDIALKAISPSMNDTTTANMCLDRLTPILGRLIQRKVSSPYRFKNGQLRVVTRHPTFDKLLADCLEQIRQNARGNVSILRQLIMVVKTVMPLTESPSRLNALKHQLELIREAIGSGVPSPADKELLLRDCDHVLKNIRTSLGACRASPTDS